MRVEVDQLTVLNNQTVSSSFVNSNSVPCLGAHKVAFWATSTDGTNQLGATSKLQVSNDNVNWNDAGAASVAQDVIAINIFSGGVLNAGGRMVILAPYNAATPTNATEGIMWRYARAAVIRNVNDVTGVTIKATVFSEM